MISNDIDRTFLTNRSFNIREYFYNRQIKYKPYNRGFMYFVLRIILFCTIFLQFGVMIYISTITDGIAMICAILFPVAVTVLSIYFIYLSYNIEVLSLTPKEKYIAKVIKEKIGKEVLTIRNCVWVKKAGVTKYYVEYRLPDDQMYYRCIIKIDPQKNVIILKKW